MGPTFFVPIMRYACAGRVAKAKYMHGALEGLFVRVNLCSQDPTGRQHAQFHERDECRRLIFLGMNVVDSFLDPVSLNC
jgi:hypothetical protein